ncbi:hypothetical protein K439DRAFT_1637302 [Ramaria rubella]|nr:hypothetical protein K439DRAFT_1637302 [Ramaria rubella]
MRTPKVQSVTKVRSLASAKHLLGVPQGIPIVPLLSTTLDTAIIQTAPTRLRQSGHITVRLHNRAALDLRPSGHPNRASSLFNLAIALQTRFDKFSDRDNLDESFVLFEHAAMDSFSSSMTRFKAAQKWAYAMKSHQHSSTILAYREALNLLHRCLIATPTADLQHRLLARHTSSLPSDAAFCAIEAGQLQTAVELLDHRRAILWSRMRGYRFPLKVIRRTNAELAERFQSLSTQLEHLATSSDFEWMGSDSLGPQSSVSFDAKITLLHTVAPKFDQVVDEIRREPGFKDFLYHSQLFALLRKKGLSSLSTSVAMVLMPSSCITTYQSSCPFLKPPLKPFVNSLRISPRLLLAAIFIALK